MYPCFSGTNVWKKHHVRGSSVHQPAGRRGHSAVVYDGVMHVFGGYQDLRGSSSELWTFDLSKSIFCLVYISHKFLFCINLLYYSNNNTHRAFRRSYFFNAWNIYFNPAENNLLKILSKFLSNKKIPPLQYALR